MVDFPLALVKNFDQKQSAVQQLYGKYLGGKKYTQWLKEKAPNFKKFSGQVNYLNSQAFQGIETWKAQTPGVLGRAWNWMSRKKPTPIESEKKPFNFSKIKDAEKTELEKKSSFHKTIAKVLTYTGMFFILAAALGPFALMPLFLSMGVATTATTMTVLVSLGAVGTALAIGGVFVNNTDAIRMHLAKTDPAFQFFVDRFIQENKEININLSEERLKDKKLHELFHQWREGIELLFDKKLRERTWTELPSLIGFGDHQNEIFAKNYIEKLQEADPTFKISDDKFKESLALLKTDMEAKVAELSKKVFDVAFVPTFKKDIEVFNLEQQAAFDRILKQVVGT